MLNYIVQLNMFESLCTGILPIKSQIIYYKLFKWSNKFGLGEPFQLSNDVLMLDTGITDKKSFILHRNLLQQKGFIQFTQGKKGSPSTYILVDLQTFGGNIPPNMELKTPPNMELKTPPNMELKTPPNNASLQSNNNKNKNKTNKEINKEKPPKHKYGEYKNVLLSDEELEKLKEEFPSDWQERIERCSEYCASRGKLYTNYLATIRNWARNEKKDGSNRPIRKNDAQAGLARAMQILEDDEDGG